MIDPWAVACFVLAMALVAMLCWFVFRELAIRTLSDNQARAMNDASAAINNLSRAIEHSDQLNDRSAEDLKRLILDVETRLTRAVDLTREWIRGQVSNGTHIHGGQNNIGRTDIHGNQLQ